MINLHSGKEQTGYRYIPIVFISIHGDPLAPLSGSQHGGQNVSVKELSSDLNLPRYAVNVFFRVGGLKTSIQEGKVGLNFESRNPQVLSRQFAYLLENPKTNSRFKKNARPYVENDSCWRSIAKPMSALYREEVSNKPNLISFLD